MRENKKPWTGTAQCFDQEVEIDHHSQMLKINCKETNSWEVSQNHLIRHIWYHTWKPVQNWTIGMTSMKPIRELKSSAANVSSRPKGRFISPIYACKGKFVALEMWQSKPTQYKVGENVRWIIINQGVSNENQSGIDNRRWQDVYIQVQSGLFEIIQQGDTFNISKESREILQIPIEISIQLL